MTRQKSKSMKAQHKVEAQKAGFKERTIDLSKVKRRGDTGEQAPIIGKPVPPEERHREEETKHKTTPN